MTAKLYDWANGAPLEDHTRRKHKILREYCAQYFTVRCQLPQQTKFRVSIIDGFAGAGRYACGSPGSPIIFIEQLAATLSAANIRRAAEGFPLLEIECLLILNDADRSALEILKENSAPLLAQIRGSEPRLHLQAHFLNGEFEVSYPQIKQMIATGGYRNVLFNLDQCGHTHVSHGTLVDIMRSTPSAEIFYTFAIAALISFLHQKNPKKLAQQLLDIGVRSEDLKSLEGLINHDGWLGAAERIVFDAFRECAPFVSPFSIHNPEGWRYWLIHFANNYRARQVYNDVLHNNSSNQAHFGRSGLNMLFYDPKHEGTLYLFDEPDRERAKLQLLDDIPRMVMETGDAMSVGEFYESAYNATPAHKDDVHDAMIESPDLEIITTAGGARRKANTIENTDVIRLKPQKTFFPLFFETLKKT